MSNLGSFLAGATGAIYAIVIALIAAGIIGAICSIVGLVRGVTNKQTTVIAVGGIGLGCAVVGVFVLPIVLWIASFICGTMACRLSKQPRVMSYEEFKQQKAMMQDPEYAEYMHMVHGVDSTTEIAGEAKFNRSVAANPVLGISEREFARLNLKAKHGSLTPSEQQMYNDYIQASMAKHGGKVKPPMSDGKLGAIVTGVIVIGLLLWFAFDFSLQNGMFDHLEGTPGIEQSAPKEIIEDLGNGTILMYGNLPISD